MAWTVLTTVTGATGGGWGVEWSPDGAYIATAGLTANTVHIIETTGWTIVASVNVGTQPYGVAWSPDGAYVACTIQVGGTGSAVKVIETTGWTVAHTINMASPAPYIPPFLSWSPDGAHIVTAGQGTSIGGNSVRVAETAGWTNLTTVPTGRINSGWSVFSPDGSQVAVSSFLDDTVDIIETAGWTVTDTTTGIDGAFGNDWSDDGAYIAVCAQNARELNVIETSGFTIAQTISGPAGPGNTTLDVTILPNGTEMLVTDPAHDNVWVVETTGWTVIQTIGVGDEPVGIDASPDSQYVAVGNSAGSSVSILYQPLAPAATGIYLAAETIG